MTSPIKSMLVAKRGNLVTGLVIVKAQIRVSEGARIGEDDFVSSGSEGSLPTWCSLRT